MVVSSSARLGAVAEHRLEIVEIEQQQPVLVGDGEGDGQHAFLHLVQVHQPRQQQRPHLRYGGADRVALLAVQIPELHGVVTVRPVVIADLLRPCGEAVMGLAGGRSGHGEAGEIALHIGDEAGDAGGRKSFDDALQGDCLAGAGRARDQAVAVGALIVEYLRLAAASADEKTLFGHPRAPLKCKRPRCHSEAAA